VPIFDWPIDVLRAYKPPLTREPDFAGFWAETLGSARRIPLEPELEPADYPADGIEISRASFAGWDGARVTCWYLRPSGTGPFPGLVFYHGYSGSRGAIYDYLGWASQGYAVLTVDCRGQNGDTNDTTVYPSGHSTGWMTLGITRRDTYYYRGVFVDCVRALDFMESRPEVDRSRIGVTGISQGGGLTLAVAGLDRRPKVAMPDVPYLCNYPRALDCTDQRPYNELIDYLRSHPGQEEQVFTTLSYFDSMNLAADISCPTLVSVGLLDQVCPPSTVFSAFNQIDGSKVAKEIRVYPFGVHAVVGAQWEEKLRWAKRYLK
jgi:cephalosporin-C deacetylase